MSDSIQRDDGESELRFNDKLNAFNVIEFSVDHDLVTRCYDEVRDVLGGESFEGTRVSEKIGRCSLLIQSWLVERHSLGVGW